MGFCYPYKRYVYNRIICNIIDSTNNTYINECISKLKVREITNTKRIEEVKEIPLYNYNKSLGIGQMTNNSYLYFTCIN